MKIWMLSIMTMAMIINTHVVVCDAKEETASDAEVAGMVLIPAGAFEMGRSDGASDERPPHSVYVDAFYIDRHEVTNAEYKKFIDANIEWQKDRIDPRFHDGTYLRLWTANDYPPGKADHPVNYISWYAAMAYAYWAGKRLPTEAEWEKAARGGDIGKSETIDATDANHGRYINDTTPVGAYAPNGYGLYDMLGNVWEWCLDEYDANFYENAPGVPPFSGGSIEDVIHHFRNIKTDRVFRGGCWTDNALFVRVENPDMGIPWYASVFGGFRCVKKVPDK